MMSPQCWAFLYPHPSPSCHLLALSQSSNMHFHSAQWSWLLEISSICPSITVPPSCLNGMMNMKKMGMPKFMSRFKNVFKLSKSPKINPKYPQKEPPPKKKKKKMMCHMTNVKKIYSKSFRDFFFNLKTMKIKKYSKKTKM